MILIEIVVFWMLYTMQAPIWTFILVIIGAVLHTANTISEK